MREYRCRESQGKAHQLGAGQTDFCWLGNCFRRLGIRNGNELLNIVIHLPTRLVIGT